MVAEESSDQPYEEALEYVRHGDFNDIKGALGKLGFVFEQTTDPNHWMYFHPELKGDPIFRYPRNLYKPHGSRRSSNQISKHDRSQARQIIEILKDVRKLGSEEGEGDNEQ